MGRVEYGRIGGNRRSGAVWQWMIMGIVLGFGCSAILVLAGLTVGYLNISLDGTGIAFGATPTPVVVTATVDASLPSATPWIITATPGATATLEQSEVQAPTATVPVSATPSPEVLATEEVTGFVTSTASPLSAQNAQFSGTGGISSVPPQLAGLVTGLVAVDGGTFQMGTNFAEITVAVRECTDAGGTCIPDFDVDAQPERPVTVDSFWVERTEVTFEQYVAFLNYLGPGSHLSGCSGRACAAINSEDPNSGIVFDTANYDVLSQLLLTYPATHVTWYGADAYCRAIGRRLPSEAEWERAARGTGNTVYPWGNTWDSTRANAAKDDENPEASVAVGQYPTGASTFGVLDMAGNLAEWTNDWYDGTYYAQNVNVNPPGPASGVSKVIRGGSWADRPYFSRAVNRRFYDPTDKHPFLGFRCASDTHGAAGGTTGSPITLPTQGTVDPATLGTGGNAAPTLPAAPTTNALPPGGNQ